MSSVMVVAGPSTQALSSHLKGKASLSVDFEYPSLVSAAKELKDRVVSIDKLIYIQMEESALTQDMQTLGELILGNYFFSVKEVVFFIQGLSEGGNSSYVDQVIKVLHTRAEKKESHVEMPEFRKILSNNIRELTFDRIYDGILGITSEADKSSGRLAVYIKERGSTARESYEEDDEEISLEPFSYRPVKSYDALKDDIATKMIGSDLLEKPEEPLPKIEGKLTRLVVPKGVTKQGAIISGLPKSGATVLSCALALSLSTKFETCVFLDLSKSKGANHLLVENSVVYSDMKCFNLLEGNLVKFQKGLTLIDDIPRGFELRFIKHLYANIQRLDCKALVINIDMDQYKSLVEILTLNNLNYLFSCIPTKVDLVRASEFAEGVSNLDLYVYEPPETALNRKVLEPSVIKPNNPWITRVIRTPMLKSLNVGASMCEKLLRV
jgi:hypothetical protein